MIEDCRNCVYSITKEQYCDYQKDQHVAMAKGFCVGFNADSVALMEEKQKKEKERAKFEPSLIDELASAYMERELYKSECERLKKENAIILLKLHELAYEVFYCNENLGADVFWHSRFCTSFENVAPFLKVDCSDGDHLIEKESITNYIKKNGGNVHME